MNIFETIRKDSLAARKAGDKVRATLLVTLMSEIQAAGKTAEDRSAPSDDISISIIKKFIKNADATAEAARDNIMAEVNAYGEVLILETYLPKQLTEDEIKTIIAGLKVGGPNIMEPTMSNIMGYFKTLYAGKYDGALVAKYAK